MLNDHHLDPPEEPELPEWLRLIEEAREEAAGEEDAARSYAPRRAALANAVNLLCDAVERLGVALEDLEAERQEPDPPDPPDLSESLLLPCRDCGVPNGNGCQVCDECAKKPCRHGNPRENCPDCDHEGDLAYDAMRESR